MCETGDRGGGGETKRRARDSKQPRPSKLLWGLKRRERQRARSSGAGEARVGC